VLNKKPHIIAPLNVLAKYLEFDSETSPNDFPFTPVKSFSYRYTLIY